MIDTGLIALTDPVETESTVESAQLAGKKLAVALSIEVVTVQYNDSTVQDTEHTAVQH